MSGVIRHVALVALLAQACLACAGCSQTKTYRAAVDQLDERVSVRARVTDDRLRCEIDAGEYRVASATLVLRDGQRLTPTTTARSPDRVVGGATLGLGTGVGRGPVGVGVGTGRRVGGRTLPGPLTAMWDRPPVDLQPWFVELALEVEPPVTATVPLGEIRQREPLEGGRERQRWNLLQGPDREFVVEPAEGPAPRFVGDE